MIKPGAALVTGGAARLGRAMALALADDGWAVAVNYQSSGDEADAWQNGAKKTMAQLLEHERCMVTGHQAFLTHDALDQIASITLQNALDHLDDAHPERQRVLGAGGSSHGHVEFKQSDSGVVLGPLEEHSVTLSDAEAAKKEEEELSALRRAKWKKNISKVKNLAGLSRGLGNAFGK